MRAEIYALRDVVAGKADAVHLHNIDSIQGLPDILNSESMSFLAFVILWVECC